MILYYTFNIKDKISVFSKDLSFWPVSTSVLIVFLILTARDQNNKSQNIKEIIESNKRLSEDLGKKIDDMNIKMNFLEENTNQIKDINNFIRNLNDNKTNNIHQKVILEGNNKVKSDNKNNIQIVKQVTEEIKQFDSILNNLNNSLKEEREKNKELKILSGKYKVLLDTITSFLDGISSRKLDEETINHIKEIRKIIN